jgi:hypothetical protein
MKRNIVAIASLAALLLAVTGCEFFPPIHGSGFPVTRSLSVTGFSRIQADTGFRITVIPDAVYSVSVTCDDNIVTYLVADEYSGTLRLGLQPGYSYSQVILSAVIHMPALTSLSLSGAAQARVDAGLSSVTSATVSLSGGSMASIAAYTCGPLTVDASGASTVTFATLAATSLTAVLSGASSLTASGTAPTESLALSGASSAHLEGLASSLAGVNLSGASRAWVNAGSGLINLNASGGSVLYHTGSPTIAIGDLSGGSSIVQL